MPDARYRGAYAEAYVRTLALAAGLNVVCAVIDDYGVDLTVKPRGTRTVRSADIQVKSWSAPQGSADFWHYDGLNEVQYNLLVGDDVVQPGFLVVLLLPTHPSQYAEVLEDGLLLRQSCLVGEITVTVRVSDLHRAIDRIVRRAA